MKIGWVFFNIIGKDLKENYSKLIYQGKSRTCKIKVFLVHLPKSILKKWKKVTYTKKLHKCRVLISFEVSG